MLHQNFKYIGFKSLRSQKDRMNNIIRGPQDKELIYLIRIEDSYQDQSDETMW